jgi:hypothetical protein
VGGATREPRINAEGRWRVGRAWWMETWRWHGAAGRWNFPPAACYLPPTTCYLPPSTYSPPHAPSGSSAAHSVRFVVASRSTVEECATVPTRKLVVLARKFSVWTKKLVVWTKKLVVWTKKLVVLDRNPPGFRFLTTHHPLSTTHLQLWPNRPTESSYYHSKKPASFRQNSPVFHFFAILLRVYMHARQKNTSVSRVRGRLNLKPYWRARHPEIIGPKANESATKMEQIGKKVERKWKETGKEVERNPPFSRTWRNGEWGPDNPLSSHPSLLCRCARATLACRLPLTASLAHLPCGWLQREWTADEHG